jgi:hypothetical protein
VLTVTESLGSVVFGDGFEGGGLGAWTSSVSH